MHTRLLLALLPLALLLALLSACATSRGGSCSAPCNSPFSGCGGGGGGGGGDPGGGDPGGGDPGAGDPGASGTSFPAQCASALGGPAQACGEACTGVAGVVVLCGNAGINTLNTVVSSCLGFLPACSGPVCDAQLDVAGAENGLCLGACIGVPVGIATGAATGLWLLCSPKEDEASAPEPTKPDEQEPQAMAY